MKFGFCYVEKVDILILSILVKRPVGNVPSVTKFSQKSILCFSDLLVYSRAQLHRSECTVHRNP